MSKHFSDSNVRATHSMTYKLGTPVSIMCVAATFTSVTYEDNGGKVQLSSAGVHGLTTSPAVGSSVYVSWASGAGVSGLYTVSSVDSTLAFTINLPHIAGLGTPIVAVANTEIIIATFPIPALLENSLVENMVLVKGSGSASTKTMRVKYDGNLINFFVATSGATIRVDGYFKNLNSKTSQISTANVAPQGNSSTTIGPLTIDTSTPKNVTVTFQNTAANDVNILYVTVVRVTI